MSSLQEQPMTAIIKKSLHKIEELQAKLDHLQAAQREPIAIVGLSCRFPGAATPEAFWRLLQKGVDAIGEIPPNRWKVDDYYDPTPVTPGKVYSRYGGFLEQIDGFDPEFFRISAREATNLDPQHRLLLEVSWEALEKAALTADGPPPRTGVFVGISERDYRDLIVRNGHALDAYFGSGNTHSTASGRLSHYLGLTGPNLAVDTACSSSLVAVALAVKSLRQQECDVALAGGVQTQLAPDNQITASQARMLSPDGRCKTFDAAADGYVRAEGCGMVVLKRLSDAVADGDPILAVIRGVAINHDGHTSGLTVPSGPAQQAVIRQALADGAVQPEQVRYIEAHGTGTALGDPIEMGALQGVFGQRTQPLVVGSVKTNIGHTEAAAGIAGLIKIVLSMQYGEIPANLHFHQPSPFIEWDQWPVKVPTSPLPWGNANSPDAPLFAGVSSFGFSGTNCHVVLQSAPPPTEQAATGKESKPERTHHLLTLSARTPQALQEMAQRYVNHLVTDANVAAEAAAENEQVMLADLCFSANCGRKAFQYRHAIVATSKAHFGEQLDSLARFGLEAQQSARQQTRLRPQIAFLFTGQGSQYVDMGRVLYETQPTFRAVLDQCEALYHAETGESLLNVLYPDQENLKAKIDDTTYTQPALFALEYALATLWQSWGIQPQVLIGHSVGEIVAACIAGVFNLTDGLKLIAARGRLMGALPQDGEMVACLADEQQVRTAIAVYPHDLAIAAVNGPASIVIAGKCAAVQAVVAQLTGAGIKTRPLTVSHAFHSPLMEPMLAAFRQVAATITYHPPQVPLVSNLTGKLAGDELLNPDYWVGHVRETVRFADGVSTLHEQGINVFLEIGPGSTLLGLAEQMAAFDPTQPTGEPQDNLPPTTCYLPSLRKTQPDWQQMLTSLGELYVCGVAIDWSAFDQPYTRRKVVLPTYPFQRQRYWVATPSATRRIATMLTPLIDQLTRSPRLQEILCETTVSVERLPFLPDHRVFGAIVAPGACYLAMVLEAAHLAYPQQPIQLVDVALPQAMVLEEAGERTVQIVFQPDTETAAKSFELISFPTARPEEPYQTHAVGQVQLTPPAPIDAVNLAAVQQRCPTLVAGEAFATLATAQQIDFGPAFRWLDEVWCGQREALGRLRCPAVIDNLAAYQLHPALLDACLQLTSALQLAAGGDPDTQETRLPFAFASCTFLGTIQGEAWWGYVQQGDDQRWQIQLLDDTGTVLVQIEGFSEHVAAAHQLLGAATWQDWLYEVQWLPQPLEQTVQQVDVDQVRPVSGVQDGEQHDLWLLFADPCGPAATLATRLQQQGIATRFVVPDQAYSLTDNLVTLNPTRLADAQQFLSDLADRGEPIEQVLYLWHGQDLRNHDLSASVPETVLHLCGGLLHLVQALSQAQLTPKLWVITERCQAIGDAQPLLHVEQAPLWGLARTIRAEHPEFDCRCLDLDTLSADLSLPDITPLVEELVGKNKESLVAYRQGGRYVARLARYQSNVGVDDDRGWTTAARQVRLSAYGSPDYLQTLPLLRRQPAAHEVEIELRAAGLNFRDVLNTLGMLQEHYAQAYGIDKAADLPLGFEGAGIVVAVGGTLQKRNPELAVGDRVMVFAEGTLASYATVDSRFVTKIPYGVSFIEAATIPMAFLTAYYGLCKLAKLQAGERVLIHAAAGGVGQAAIQIAQAIGAEVYVTASPSKWDFLREQKIQHVYNSRTLDFTQALLTDTAGQGVDVVLNSLNGDFIAHSVDTLGTPGRFVEIGKIGIWTAAEMQSYRPDVAYYPFELGDDHREDEIAELLAEVSCLFADGKLKPIPQHVYPITQMQEAVRLMQQAQHRGKIVLSIPSISMQTETTALSKAGSYLITGGLGGLGLQTAQSLAQAGAEHLILNGRKAIPSTAAQAIIDRLRQQRVTVDVIAADVADETECQSLLHECQQRAALQQRRLKGIIHAAGVLDDGVLLQQHLDRFTTVMAAKVQGAWHLHQLSQTMDLDFFVAFSSTASVTTEAGQGNYAAANAFLDALMQHRQASGLPSLSINWGAWAEVGMAAKFSFQQRGLASIQPAQGGEVLMRLLSRIGAQSQPQVAVQPTAWQHYLAHVGIDTPFYAYFAQELQPAQVTKQLSSSAPTPVSFRQQLMALSGSKRDARLLALLEEIAHKVLGLAVQQTIHPQQGLMNLGMDSLMAVEFRNHLTQRLAQSLPATLLFDYPTLGQLHKFLSAKMFVTNDAAPQSAKQESSQQAISNGSSADPDNDLVTDEIAQMLAQALNMDN